MNRALWITLVLTCGSNVAIINASHIGLKKIFMSLFLILQVFGSPLLNHPVKKKSVRSYHDK